MYGVKLSTNSTVTSYILEDHKSRSYLNFRYEFQSNVVFTQVRDESGSQSRLLFIHYLSREKVVKVYDCEISFGYVEYDTCLHTTISIPIEVRDLFTSL